jgi:ligand-binding sensor domain-containing protein
MNSRKLLVLFSLVFGINCLVFGQNPPLSFHHLTVENGLNDGHIQMIGQDKFGYMWFGSLGALNRYDGRTMRTYAYRAGDPTSPLSGMAFSMVTDSAGHLFFGFQNGLAEFDFLNNNFKRIKAVQDVVIFRMINYSKNALFLITDKGLIKYDPLSKNAIFYKKTDNLLNIELQEGILKDDKLYLGTTNGFVIFDIKTEKTTRPNLPILNGLTLPSLCFDDQNRLWVTSLSQPKLLRFSADLTTYETYDTLLKKYDPVLSREYFIIKDKKKRIWISTKHIGLLQYLPETNSFAPHIQDEQKPWTPSSDTHLSIFCDKDGMIWLGSAEGVNYFHPDKNLFETILPFDTELGVRNRRLARTVVEDTDKNLWFGTPDGVSKYDTKTKTYRTWRNEPNKPPVLAYNSIRHLLCDEQNNIWIVTSRGLTRYNRKADKMEILDKDTTFPLLRYMRISKDNAGDFWFATQGSDGYYQYNQATKILRGISQHPHLQRFTGFEGWSFLQDSRGRYWFGSSEKGVGMYDPTTQKTYHWRSEGYNSIAGDVIMDIKEDRDGLIWIATNHGATRIDFEKNGFLTFNSDNGLGSSSVFALAVDAFNRVWIGTGNGLVMVDSNRLSLTHFGTQDGLPSTAFTVFPAYTTPDGIIIMATQKGYIRFNPLNYKTEKRKLDCYIASFTASNVEKALYPIDEKATAKAFFEAHENAFSLNLVALNYFNPSQTWYAYKLDGFDKDWHITQDPKAVYANLSGGNYTFHYKASLNVNDWDVVEKTLDIKIDTVFYKAFWFWGLLASGFGSLIFVYYRTRKAQKDHVEGLQRKAQLLEKEKAVMQYEGLKQQLNPHFLFNSLTSLSSLIQIDTKIANEFLESLSKTYRYILKSSESETVLLSDEIKFAQNYVSLQKTRFEGGLFVNINVSEAALHHKIVPVTLQNLIENAMKHNIIDDESPLNVDIFTENDGNTDLSRDNREGAVSLIIRNNIQKKNFVATSNKRGLTNLVNLYHYLSNTPVEITETTEFFTVKIPLL